MSAAHSGSWAYLAVKDGEIRPGAAGDR